MLEIPLRTIRGFEEDTMTMLEVQAVFKAIRDGKIRSVSWVDAKGEYESHDIRIVTLCKDCQKRFANGCRFYMSMIETKDDFFCADGEAKDGD